MSKMRDADMPLVERIGAAIERIAHGQAAMRVPVEATDPDVVLADCQMEIERLTAALRAQPGPVSMDDAEWAGKVHLQDAQQEIERLHAVAQHEADCVDAYRAQVETLTAERDEARQRAEYWKAEHLAGNAEIDELRRQFDPMGEYASADELIAALRAEKAADDAMKRDAECWRELDRMMSDPDARLNVNAGGWAVLKCGLLGKLGGGDV